MLPGLSSLIRSLAPAASTQDAAAGGSAVAMSGEKMSPCFAPLRATPTRSPSACCASLISDGSGVFFASARCRRALLRSSILLVDAVLELREDCCLRIDRLVLRPHG